jgi:hypothetical protein
MFYLSTLSLDFGQVRTGHYAELTYSITNIYEGEFNVIAHTPLAEETCTAFLVSAEETGIRDGYLSRGESAIYTVGFWAPIALGPCKCRIWTACCMTIDCTAEVVY